MTIFVLLLLLAMVVAGLAGWGADSRDTDYRMGGLIGHKPVRPHHDD